MKGKLKKMEETKFTYGDAVKIKENAPKKFRPNECGDICGFTIIKNNKQVVSYNVPLNTTVYLVEYGDGSDNEIPETYLELYIGQ